MPAAHFCRGLDHRAYRLGAGDSISFAGLQPNQLRNDGAVAARAIICVSGGEEGHRRGS